jgi:predicted AlkP superfamily pyrophosphatase or phosphodiesterase
MRRFCDNLRLIAFPQELVFVSLDAFTYSKIINYGRRQIREIPTETSLSSNNADDSLDTNIFSFLEHDT